MIGKIKLLSSHNNYRKLCIKNYTGSIQYLLLWEADIYGKTLHTLIINKKSEIMRPWVAPYIKIKEIYYE
jgi:hypothetical protein